ncbi:MAG: N-acetylmuramoyl-L-alanine amidase [Bacteroidia bacterium]|nr:N-acetylmuramoyl-L-alanine amidase [Bacteroidia bacterium]
MLLACWYGNTSFQISNMVSVVLQPDYFVEEPSIAPNYYKKVQLVLEGNKTHRLNLGQLYSAIKVQGIDSSNSWITAETGHEQLTFGKSIDDPNIDIPINFKILEKSTNLLVLNTATSTAVEIELFYAPPISIKSNKERNKKADCEKPITIPQSEWRSGLPEPDSGRNEVTVKHCIIHHSAGSNTDTNYVNTIRNIYLLHTQSNGWDDIGYNFVIAPNGTIFSGRDPQGVAEEDNIQGAHFCGKNSGTMGICLLGNYNLTSPTSMMKGSLNELLAWKLHKEEIDANISFPHPTSWDENLGSVAMHKDGCPTACPGDSVSLIIDDIKYDVQQAIDACSGSVAIQKSEKKFKQMVYPNPSSGKFYALIEKRANISTYRILDQQGNEIQKSIYPASGKITTNVPSGSYYLELRNKNNSVSTQIILIENQ